MVYETDNQRNRKDPWFSPRLGQSLLTRFHLERAKSVLRPFQSVATCISLSASFHGRLSYRVEDDGERDEDRVDDDHEIQEVLEERDSKDLLQSRVKLRLRWIWPQKGD